MYNRQLDIFLCVADCGSFTKAADKLFLSSTAVMKQMNRLEKHWGMRLFTRTNHGVHLTLAGESVYKDARFLISYSERALEKARQLENEAATTLRVGTSILNPCKVFMDLWNRVNDRFPQFKISIVPFEDRHEEILSVIDSIGQRFDFLVGVCDSAEWLSRCRFYPLGEYRRCVAVPATHRLAAQSLIRITDLYGETLIMVKRGDSPVNDRIRDYIEREHPQIRIEDAPAFYDMDVFNRCARENCVLSTVECWADVHPSLVTIPVDWEDTIPYGLLYSKTPAEGIGQFLEAVEQIRQNPSVPLPADAESGF